MPDKTDKIATNIGYGVIITGTIAAAIGIFILIFKLSIVNFMGSLLAPLLTGLAIQGKWIRSFEVRKLLPMPALALSAICGFAFMMNSHKYKAEAADLFLPGQIIIHNVFMKGDGETVDHYKDRYEFKPARANQEDLIEAIYYIMLAVSFISIVLCYQLLGRWQIIEKEHDRKKSRYAH
jgi:hypothetical protein